MVSRYRSVSLDPLLPSFRERITTLLERLEGMDHKPVAFETLRSPERAAQLAKDGRGIRDSMHLYGAAADIICDQHGWLCASKSCRFYVDLGTQAEALRLTWGGRFKRVDMPHVQALRVADQEVFRRLEPEQRDAFVRVRLAGPKRA